MLFIQVSDLQGQFEEEKFNLQKQHTKNIQELLDDTNTRLAKMEGEYSQQMEATVRKYRIYISYVYYNVLLIILSMFIALIVILCES